MTGDALGAIAALVAGLVIRAGGSPKADAVASLLVAAILVVGSLRILFDGGLVLFEAAPAALAGRHHPRHGRRVSRGRLGSGSSRLDARRRARRHYSSRAHRSPDAAFGQRLAEQLKGALEVEYVTVQVEQA
jgi:Co/Zn/Cd efflux system component